MTKRSRAVSVGTQIDLEPSPLEQDSESGSNRRKKRQRELAEFERNCPIGWKLDPIAVQLLQNSAYSSMVPRAVPARYPPRMLPQHLLKLLPNLEEMETPLVDKTIAEDLVLQSAAYGDQREFKINVVLLWTGQSMDRVPYRWILLRLFGKRWRYKDQSYVVTVGDQEVKICIKEANLLWPSPTCQQLIQEASVFVMMVESLVELEDLLEKLVPCLEQGYDEHRLISPFLCFTSFLQDSSLGSGDLNGMDSWLQAEEQEEIELCFRKAHLEVGLEVVSVKDHLNTIKQHLYNTVFLKKWNASEKDSHSSSFDDESSVYKSLTDPFKKVSKFLSRSLSLRLGKKRNSS